MSITDITTKAREYRELQLYIKQLEEEAEAIKQALIAEMEARETDNLHADILTVKYTTVKSNRLDTTTLKKELPDIAARYTKTTEGKRFTVA